MKTHTFDLRAYLFHGRRTIFSALKAWIFFKKWGEGLVNEGVDIHHGKQVKFLSWQTWDESRLTIFGFLSFLTIFSKVSYFIVPVRANGSAIETIFGQLKNQKGSCAKLCVAESGYRLAMRDTKINVHIQHTR
eukprot:Pompholyxophrys_punicea_v1_NODE_1110_length_950_cov_1.471508.p1 type:complete len:133 gc:universal NODE_1110_length_950_cov_1.471508:491-889(+)